MSFVPDAWSQVIVRSVLLIDDDDELRTTLAEFLGEEGYVVHTARNGQDAVDLLHTIDPPALILVDFSMPVMNGTQFLAAKGRDARLSSIPVAILSAFTREWSGEAIGVNHVLTKPIDPERLLTLIAQYCDRKPAGTARG